MNRAIVKRFVRPWTITLGLMATCLTCPATCQDTITVRNADGELLQRSGLLVDINADRVVLKVGDREQKIPFEQVVDVRVSLEALAAPGDQLLSERKYELAFAAYGKGLEASTPAWMRRRLLAGRIQAAVQMQAWSQAADDFLALVASDPRTQYFRVIPLTWTSSPADPAAIQKIPAWLKSNNRLERLIGASLGLADLNREASLRVLQNLSSDGDPRIAALAQAQLWRVEVKFDRETLSRWTAQVNSMPEDLRGGPHFVLGNAWAQVDPEQAVLQLMRVPVLYGDRFDLSARALLQAAELSLKLNRGDEARIMLQEIIDRHAASAEADAAAETLKRFASSNHPQ